MALYSYVKSSHPTIDYQQPKPAGPVKKVSRVISLAFLSIGLFMIGQVAYPIIASYLSTMSLYSPEIVSPLAQSQSQAPGIFSAPVQAFAAVANTTALNSTTTAVDDSYRPSTWFPGAAQSVAGHENTEVQYYTLTIPKLKIDAATVEFGGTDLKKSLVAWPTSAMPGNFGVNIIFGHSELPQFASPDNFSGIFTHLMDLNNGDDIYINYDGVRYHYQVVDKKIIEPTDLSILEQRFDAAYVSLITCEPPGTVWKRGVVRAQLTQT